MTSVRLLDPRAAAVRSLRDLTEGQRWTVGIALVVIVLFLGFGMRRAPDVLGPFTTAGAAPPPAVVAAPPSAPAPPVDEDPGSPPTPLRPATPAPAPGPAAGLVPDLPAPSNGVADDAVAPSVIAVVRTDDGAVAGRDDAAVAGVFLADVPDARVVEVDDAAGVLCGSTGPGTVVVAGDGLPDRLRECVTAAGAVLLSHDDRGSSGTALSTALGAGAALVEAGRVAGPDGALGLVVEAPHAEQARAAERVLEEEGFVVEVAVVDEQLSAPAMLDLVGKDVEQVVLGTPVESQSRWLSIAQTLRMPFEHLVADIGDSIVNEGYTGPVAGVHAVAATRVAWFARDHAETEAQERCRTRFEDAVGSEVAGAGELARVLVWCQHASMAAAMLEQGGRAEGALASGRYESPVTSDLVMSTSTGFGPEQVAVLDWDQRCRCWTESVPYTARRGPS